MALTVDVDVERSLAFLLRVSRWVDQPSSLLLFLSAELIKYEAQVFATKNFGQWADLHSVTVRYKGNRRVLVDTGGLLRDLTTPGGVKTSGDTVTVSTDRHYAKYHKGGRGVPKRDPAPAPPRQLVASWAEDLLGVIVHGGPA